MPLFAAILPPVVDWQMALPVSAGVACAAAALVIGRRLGRRVEPEPLPVERAPALDVPSWCAARAARPAAKERRRSPRRDGRLIKVQLRHAGGERAGDAVILDRSNGGVRLAADYCLPLGSQVELRPAGLGEELPWIAIEVRNCRHRPLRGWEMGCLFITFPPHSTLDAL